MQKTLRSERNIMLLRMLVQLRRDRGVTQVELASRLGMAQTDVSRIERGSRRMDVFELHEWLDALGAGFIDFLVELDVKIESLDETRSLGSRDGVTTN